MSFCSNFIWGDIIPGHFIKKQRSNLYSPAGFPSVLKNLSSNTIDGWTSSWWVAAYLGSTVTTSLSTPEKKNNPHIALRHEGVFSSSHRSLWSRSMFLRKDVTAWLCQSIDCALDFSPPFHSFFGIFKPTEHARSAITVTANKVLGSAAVQGIQILLAGCEKRRWLEGLLHHLQGSRAYQGGTAVLFS